MQWETLGTTSFLCAHPLVTGARCKKKLDAKRKIFYLERILFCALIQLQLYQIEIDMLQKKIVSESRGCIQVSKAGTRNIRSIPIHTVPEYWNVEIKKVAAGVR